MSEATRPRRLLLSGGSRLSRGAALLWRELGRLLAVEDGLVVITGGLAGFKGDPDAWSADRVVIEGLLEGLRARGISPEERIETVLPDRERDWDKLIRFREGRIRVLGRRTAQARRFSMVQLADVVVAIEGEHGTRSVLDVALAIERPVLPLPFGGGASAEVWRDVPDEVARWFRISNDEAAEFERIRLEDLGDTEIVALAARVHAWLMRGFTKTCFVIMPFQDEHATVYDQAIRPALEGHGLRPVRTDRSVVAGNVVEAIRDGLRHCYFAIADTTADRPNVMYELGMAHADGKPVILLRHAGADGTLSNVPFDVQSESILRYSDDMDDLRRRIEAAVAVILGKVRSVDEA